jgi:hypothetical protein
VNFGLRTQSEWKLDLQKISLLFFFKINVYTTTTNGPETTKETQKVRAILKYFRCMIGTSTNKQNMKFAQAMILGNCRVSIVEIAASLGVNDAHPWCKPLV